MLEVGVCDFRAADLSGDMFAPTVVDRRQVPLCDALVFHSLPQRAVIFVMCRKLLVFQVSLVGTWCWRLVQVQP